MKGGKNIKKPEFKLLAGQMVVENGKVKPNPNKGELRFAINSDNLLIFEWKDLETGISSEPLVIFDGEWEWVKRGTAKGRVYCLQSTTFGDKLYYWMQYPNAAEDDVNENLITNILKTGRLELNEEKDATGDLGSVRNIVNSEGTTGGNQNPPSQKTGGVSNADFIKSFASAMKGGAAGGKKCI
jgi:hypothetical protein